MRVSSEAMRAMFQPCSRVWLTQPQITSSTSAGSIFELRASTPSISCADMVSARVLRCMPPLERPIGVRPKSTMTTSLGFSLISLIPRLTVEALAVGSHLAQLPGRLIQRAQVGVLVGQRHELGDTDGIDVAKRTATDRREANAVDQAHVGLGGSFDNAVFKATNGFQTQGDHHEIDDVLV